MIRIPPIMIFGISGVGKSWLASRCAEKFGLKHVEASELLKNARSSAEGRLITKENLRDEPIIDNQVLLIDAFQKLHALTDEAIIFDGHSIIDTKNGLIEIPLSVIQAINPCALVFLKDDAENIMKRRNSDTKRSRPFRTVEELNRHQDLAFKVCNNYAGALKTQLHVLFAGDEIGLSKIVRHVIAR